MSVASVASQAVVREAIRKTREEGERERTEGGVEKEGCMIEHRSVILSI